MFDSLTFDVFMTYFGFIGVLLIIAVMIIAQVLEVRAQSRHSLHYKEMFRRQRALAQREHEERMRKYHLKT